MKQGSGDEKKLSKSIIQQQDAELKQVGVVLKNEYKTAKQQLKRVQLEFTYKHIMLCSLQTKYYLPTGDIARRINIMECVFMQLRQNVLIIYCSADDMLETSCIVYTLFKIQFTLLYLFIFIVPRTGIDSVVSFSWKTASLCCSCKQCIADV